MTMPIPDGSVVITPAQMYQQIGELANAVRDLQGVVDPALQDMRHDVGDHETRIRAVESLGLTDVTARVTALEQRRYVSPAALYSAIGLAVSCLAVLVAFLSIRNGG